MLLDKRLLVRREVRARGLYFCAKETRGGLLTMVTAPTLSTVIFHPFSSARREPFTARRRPAGRSLRTRFTQMASSLLC